MFIDLTDLEVEDTITASGGTEFIRAFARGQSGAPTVIHRVAGGVGAGVTAVHQTRRFVEKYHFGCMLNIVASLGSATQPAVVYEDVQFRHLASRRTATTKKLLEQAIQLVEALREVHSAGMVLNCVQPTTFVLTDSAVKILDFGQASPLQIEHRDLKSPWQLQGDLRYIAPEQTGRLNRGVDYRSDYYSLGVVLYEMFVGATPFQSKDPLDLVYEHLTKTPVSPHEFDPSIPPFISDIIQKLLSKDPARRYQSAEGILADLTLALQARTDVPPDPNQLGHLDVPYILHISARIYGRVNERAELISAYERACEGSREMVYLSGYSGIGKTSLIRETYIPITRQRSYFISGKFEQLERRLPYSAWLDACRNLLATVLTEPDHKLAEIRQLADAALGANAGVLTEVLPELATLVGHCPPSPPLPPRETQERFVQSFCRFISVFCAPGRPLAVFLDDLQWADAASLELLERVVADPSSRYVFVIVAARNNELTQTHPFTLTMGRIETFAGMNVTSIALPALSRGELTQLVADTFRLPSAEAAPLSDILAIKSGGNPFFAWQFLRLLRTKGLVEFSPQRMRWTWDLSEINSLAHSENVIDLMLHRLHQLPEQTRIALSWAACLGAHFELSRLALVMSANESQPASTKLSLGDVYTALEPALIEELIVAMGSPMTIDGTPVLGKLRFSHDRVQEAAYKLVGDEKIPAARLHIARLLLGGATQQQISENVFDIADHLNAATSLITGRNERIEHTRINLLAARRAAESAAFDAALKYATSGMTLVPADMWFTNPELARSLWCARGEYEYLNSHFEPAERFVREAIAFETDTHTKAELHHMLVVQYTLRAAYADAISSARAGLALLSVHLPDENLVEMRDAELAKVRDLLAGRSLKSLGNLERMNDHTQLVVMKLLIAMGPPCYRSHPRLWSLIVVYELRLCLEHGVAPGATYTFPAFGGLLQYLGQGSADECRDLHAATCALLPFVTSPTEASVGHLMMGSSLDHWFAPLAYSSQDYRQAFVIGVDSGNLQYAAYALAHDAYCKFYQGIPLQKLISEVEGYRDFCTRRKNFWGMDITEGVLRIAHALASDSPSADFSLDQNTEADYLNRCARHGNVQVLGIYFTLAAGALLHMGRLEDAARALVRASEHLDCFASQGLLPSTQYHFIHGLLLVSVPECFGLSATEALAKAQSIATQAKKWATECPDNYLHVAALLDAEIAVATGADVMSIVDAFDLAVAAAFEQKNFHRAGLAAARAAAWWKKQGKPHYAAIYEIKAKSAYQAWQAGSVIGLVQSPPLRTVAPPPLQSTSASDTLLPEIPAFRPSAMVGQEIDIQSIVRTAQAVAKSTELADVVQAVIDNVKKVSGAGRTVLLLPHHQGVMHAWETRPGKELQDDGVPFDNLTDLPRTVVQYVMRTLTTLRVHGNEESSFSRDPYIQATHPASIVCVPILLAQQMQGILYLEHHELSGAFDEARLQFIEFLAAAAAAAVRNANLVRELRADIALRITAETMKSEFVSTVSHELRTPITAIRGSLGLLVGGVIEELSIEVKELLGIALANSERLSRLVDDLLDFDKIERGTLVLHMEKVLLLHALKRAIERNRGFAVKYQVELVLDAPESLGGVLINADPDRFMQIITNLLSNAVKFSPPNSLVLVRAMLQMPNVRIEVRDAGEGVPALFRSRLFQRFSQADSSDTRRHSGTGLGLSITRELVGRLGGSVGYEPIEPTGSCFFLEFPIA